MSDFRKVLSNKWCITRPNSENRKTFELGYMTKNDMLTILFKSSEDYIDLSINGNISEEDTKYCLPYQIYEKSELVNPNEIIDFENGNKFLAKDCRGIYITTKEGLWCVSILESDLYNTKEEALEAFKKTSEFRLLKQKIKHFENNREFLLSLIY